MAMATAMVSLSALYQPRKVDLNFGFGASRRSTNQLLQGCFYAISEDG